MQTREELANAIFEWIECWYNPHRRHSSLGMHSPVTFEASTPGQTNTTDPTPPGVRATGGTGTVGDLCEWHGVTSAASGRGLEKITDEREDASAAAPDLAVLADQLVAASRTQVWS
jgi:Integrase core domain